MRSSRKWLGGNDYWGATLWCCSQWLSVACATWPRHAIEVHSNHADRNIRSRWGVRVNADLMVVTLAAVVVVDGCDLVSIAQLVVRAGLLAVLVVMGNLDNGGLFDYDVVGVT